MEIRTLRYFLAVAREENMTKAADTLHVTQPTLSKALKSLEDELGKKLFTRHSFSIRLTEEGVLLRNRAEDLVSMADRIEREFLSLDEITGGDLYLGLAESYQICFLAREIHTLKQSYPGLLYHITSGDTEQVAEKLDKGLLDFAVLAEIPDCIFRRLRTKILFSGGQQPHQKRTAERVQEDRGLVFLNPLGIRGLGVKPPCPPGCESCPQIMRRLSALDQNAIRKSCGHTPGCRKI